MSQWANETTSFFWRKSIRLKEYDYSQPGAYFVTICTRDRGAIFGDVVDGEMRMSQMGEIASRCWREIADHFTNVELDEFEVMPIHVHGIIDILENPKPPVTHPRRDVQLNIPTETFFEHIIRNDRSLTRIREYTVSNPRRWTSDKENLRSEGKDEFDQWLESTGKKPARVESK